MPDGTCALGGDRGILSDFLKYAEWHVCPRGYKGILSGFLKYAEWHVCPRGYRGILQDLLKSAYFFLRVFTIHRRPCASVYFFAWTDAPSREA